MTLEIVALLHQSWKCDPSMIRPFVLPSRPRKRISETESNWFNERHKGAIVSLTSLDFHSVYDLLYTHSCTVRLDVAFFNRHSDLPPAECYLFMSQPFHSADPKPVGRLAGLTGTICSPSQFHTDMHAHINTDHTNVDTQASCLLHGPC